MPLLQEQIRGKWILSWVTDISSHTSLVLAKRESKSFYMTQNLREMLSWLDGMKDPQAAMMAAGSVHCNEEAN